MTTLRTDLRNTRDAADRVRFRPLSDVLDTNVQDAIADVDARIALLESEGVRYFTGPGNTSLLSTDKFLDVNTGAAAIVNLPAVAGRDGPATIKGTGATETNTVTITPNAVGETIDGMATVVISTDGGAFTIRPNEAKTKWLLG